jgi:ribosomal protein S18 acetylase RimI-like enzyme
MIARHWKGITKPEEAENYLAYLKNERFPHVATLAGYIDAEILQRKLETGVEFLIISYWQSLESIKAFAGENVELAVVPPNVEAMMLSYDKTASHYEVYEDAIKLVPYTCGALGRTVELHGSYYAANWDMGLYFEAKVATELAEFLSRFNPANDGAWFAQHNGKIIGSIFIDGSKEDRARLRWFIIDPAYQGYGLGKRLMDAAMGFCREKGFERVYLTTFKGLNAARHLYEKHGFILQSEEDGSHLTGKSSLIEQVFEWRRA